MEPTTLAMMFLVLTNQFELPKGLLSAVCYVESKHRPGAINKQDKGPSLGLCQMKVATAKMLGFKANETALMNAKINSYYAAKYLAFQIKRYKGDSIKAIAAYNAGTYKEGKQGFPINQTYVNKVFKAWLEHR